MRKSEKLKKIQLLLNQKNLYEDQYERLLAATGDWKSNYTDYLITEPIDLVEGNVFRKLIMSSVRHCLQCL